MQKPPVIKRLATLAFAFASAALALGTPAGTVIQNTATLQFLQDDGTPVETSSPPVNTTVAAVCSPSVLPNGTVAQPGQTANLLPGESTVFKYTIANTGNASNTFALSTAADTASQFTPSDVAIYQDSNGNGQIDAGESPITQITLAADATANLLVKASSASSSRGSAYLNLIAACATNTHGLPNERDDNNVAQINLGELPNFTLTKTFSPSVLKPAEQTTVNIMATNTGGASRPISISDFLNTPEMRDFVYVSGSARSTGTTTTPAPFIEFSSDGTNWSTTEPTTVAAVRVRADSVAPQGTLGLTFALRATEAALGTHRNVAQLVSSGQTLEAPADITVRYLPSIALGPIGNPEAKPGGELSSDDQQTKSNALLNQEVCFSHTVKNLGDRDDTITTTGTVDAGSSTIVFKDMAGNTIAAPFQVTLAPGATSDFQACYTPTQAAAANALKVTLTSTSSRGAAPNKTVDLVNTVEDKKLGLLKSSDQGSGFVSPGQELTYTLKFTNNQSFALTNVVIKDDLNTIQRVCLGPTSLNSAVTTQSMVPQLNTKPLTAQAGVKAQASGLTPLDFISADNGGVLEGTIVVWRFPTVAAGQTLTLTLKVRVPAGTPDCATITNVFTAESSELPTPTPSNPVTNQVYDQANFSFVKTSTPTTVVIGEEITYIFTVRNLSATMPLSAVKIEDNLPDGLQYVEGSSQLDGAAFTPTVDPADPRHYTWIIPGLAAGSTAQITFRALVMPSAPAQLKNNGRAVAVLGERESQPSQSSATTKIQPLSFGPNNADIVGYVFQDVNRNGIYDYGTDIPCQNARVILSNGRIELTDAQGRYHFRNVREGEWALRLDPNSVAAQNLSMPMDAGRAGSRLTYVRNLTSIDFPLAPDAGDIAVIRDTTLTMKGGPVDAQNTFQVRKQVFGTTGDPTLYTVQLTLSASAPLNAFTLTDPLPAGATLVDGQNTMTIDPLPGGSRLITYRFRYSGDVRGAVTDPTASWRY